MWGWTTPYAVAGGVGGLEAFWLYTRYYLGRPEDRARVINEAFTYLLAWVIALSIYSFIESGLFYTAASWLSSMAGVDLAGFGITYNGSVQAFINHIGVFLKLQWDEVFEMWLNYWTLVTLFKFITGIGVGFGYSTAGVQVSVNPSALAGWIQNYAWSFSTGLEWLMADLAFLYGAWVIWSGLYFTGAWIWGVSLIVPRTTRPIGASLASAFLTLSISLPTLAGVTGLLVTKYTGFSVLVPCSMVELLRSPSSCLLGFKAAASTLTSLLAYFQVGLNMPYYGYELMVWDAVLDVAYVITVTFTAWLARLIDERSPSLLTVP